MNIIATKFGRRRCEISMTWAIDLETRGDGGLANDYTLTPDSGYGIYLMPDLTVRVAPTGNTEWWEGEGDDAVLLAMLTTDEHSDIIGDIAV